MSRVATSFRMRARGLRPWGMGRGLVLRARSVHGRGMAESLAFVGVDDTGTVIAVGTLDPGRLVLHSGARWFVEIPAGDELPDIGTRLEIELVIDSRSSCAEP